MICAYYATRKIPLFRSNIILLQAGLRVKILTLKMLIPKVDCNINSHRDNQPKTKSHRNYHVKSLWVPKEICLTVKNYDVNVLYPEITNCMNY